MTAKLWSRCLPPLISVCLVSAPTSAQEVLAVRAGVWNDSGAEDYAWAGAGMTPGSLWDTMVDVTPDATPAERLRPEYNWNPGLQLRLQLVGPPLSPDARPETLDLIVRIERSLATPTSGESLESTLVSADVSDFYNSSYGKQFIRGWALITGVEVSLLVITMAAPKEWTGWTDDFVKDGLNNLERAWTSAPMYDGDHWFHNFVGHPYGGSVYYNTVRSQGAGVLGSFFFSAFMSAQWEYAFEAFAEQPSIQDIFITPISGAILGEAVHTVTVRMVRNGTSVFEKAFILLMNPTHVVMRGFN
ncbi:MAG TPA: DUF3943 domain-containing protein [Gemmatimonadota bacterium]|nr:DUF3943 domain-containing protein [Gemmatimonadota bacterium]